MSAKDLAERLARAAALIREHGEDAEHPDPIMLAEASTILTRLAEQAGEIERLRAHTDGMDAREETVDDLRVRLAAAEKALEPLARLEIPERPQGNAGAYSIRHADIKAARAAMTPTSEGK